MFGLHLEDPPAILDRYNCCYAVFCGKLQCFAISRGSHTSPHETIKAVCKGSWSNIGRVPKNTSHDLLTKNNPSLRIQVCPKSPGLSIHSFRMGLEPSFLFDREGSGFLGHRFVTFALEKAMEIDSPYIPRCQDCGKVCSLRKAQGRYLDISGTYWKWSPSKLGGNSDSLQSCTQKKMMIKQNNCKFSMRTNVEWFLLNVN